MTSAGGRMRVLLVTNWIGWAGAETQLAHLAVGLRQAGHEVTMVATGRVLTDVARLCEAGVEVASLDVGSRWRKPLVPLRLQRFVRRADVVHCTGWDATLWGRLAALLGRRPVLITEHTPGREHQASNRLRLRAIQLHNRLLDRFTYATVIVGEWQQGLLESEGVRGTIVHIPNGVPAAELRERAERGPGREELGIPAEARVVIEVARFAPQKGQEVVLRAVAAMRERLGDVRVLFVGVGETEAAVKAEAERLGAEWASFLGHRPDIPGLLRLADAAVLPSTGEGLPMALIEAIAVGTPVVATDVGDVRWLLQKTGAGLVVPPHDEGAFAAELERLLGDEELRGRLRAAAAAGLGELDAPAMVASYERVLAAAVESRRRPAAAR